MPTYLNIRKYHRIKGIIFLKYITIENLMNFKHEHIFFLYIYIYLFRKYK